MHRTVNHSIEFVKDSGDSTNKIEGHWRHAKVKMPPFGVRKHHFVILSRVYVALQEQR